MTQNVDPSDNSAMPETQLKTEPYDSVIEEVTVEQPPATIEAVKASEDVTKDDQLDHSSRGPSISTTVEAMSDAASLHSVPAVHVSAPESPAPPSSNGHSPVPPPSPSPSRTSALTREQNEERSNRHRSTAESRSTNRLSGFFNSLLHRRENTPQSTTANSIREEVASNTNAEKPNDPATSSRPSSPPPRPTTPPPSLPPPTLQELGLSLSVVTSDLSPSHFSTPPTSGAFMAPHYLLLCHAQGLDVLPLVSPPQPQPYALVRRVSFKSVVVMEQRGVLVAIAGRRDGVRVYALEEVRKAIEWRIDVEVKRERERARRDNLKKLPTMEPFDRDSQDKVRKPSLSTPPPGEITTRHLGRKSSVPTIPIPPVPSLPAEPLIPRTPTTRPVRRAVTTPLPKAPPAAVEQPPPYLDPPPQLTHRARSNSIAEVLGPAPLSRIVSDAPTLSQDPDAKANWQAANVDDDAIDIVAAGASGGQALDERTSARLSANLSPSSLPIMTQPSLTSPASPSRRNRPANLDLTLANSTSMPQGQAPPSPAPTLVSLRQALSVPLRGELHDPDTPAQAERDEEEGHISLAQALMESRIPDLPPPGTRQDQRPILISSSHSIAGGDGEDGSPRTSETHSLPRSATPESRRAPPVESNNRSRRRRWSVIIGQALSPSPAVDTTPTPPPTAPATRSPGRLVRSQSYRSTQSATSTVRQSSISETPLTTSPTTTVMPTPTHTPSIASSHSARSSRFLPRIISNVLQSRREDRSSPIGRASDGDSSRKTNGTPLATHFPPPKLEYVKLPGTKGALMVKAVETPKKSFLAILCGENGEKVELFAGTYRTALGLSRTFILPDSPRSLELQLQGDDLVEVFLVFSQNVFGLEPATVRVREIRIGRAERRAARRRVREIRSGENPDSDPQPAEDETNVNVSIGVTVASQESVAEVPPTPMLVASQHPTQQSEQDAAADQQSDSNDLPATPTDAAPSALAHAEELFALATAQMGPYTTFQQLSFAPNFPLASIADEYVIPPTYADFIDYRSAHEPEASNDGTDLAQVQFSPPGLPVPTPTAPSKWFYRDPKNVVHGPWKASLMQAWFKDGLLPFDLPVRREEDSEYLPLKELRQQCVDPAFPFRSAPTVRQSLTIEDIEGSPPFFQATSKPLLKPISLLAQPKHYGPPALFFSSRGGHSTTIVDARGRSVLKGRFVWSEEEQDSEVKQFVGRMGDVKRIEAFDVEDRSVLVAMRQGGLEAVDLGDALLRPGDESRTILPQFNPPPSNLNRRGPWVWKIGTPIPSLPGASSILAGKVKTSGYGGHLPVKKLSTNAGKSPSGRTEFNIGHEDGDSRDEVLFLGRKGDEIYICERNQGVFRILRLSPSS